MWRLKKPNIEKLGSKKNIKGLIKVLKHSYIPVSKVDDQIKAEKELIRIGENTVEPLIALLHDKKINSCKSMACDKLRYSVIYILGNIGGDRSVDFLLNALTDKRTTYSAATALAETGDLRAIEPLKMKLNDINFGDKTCIALALAKLEGGGRNATDALIVGLKNVEQDRTSYNKIKLINALGKFGDYRAFELIQHAIETAENWRVAEDLAEAETILLTRMPVDIELFNKVKGVNKNGIGLLSLLLDEFKNNNLNPEGYKFNYNKSVFRKKLFQAARDEVIAKTPSNTELIDLVNLILETGKYLYIHNYFRDYCYKKIFAELPIVSQDVLIKYLETKSELEHFVIEIIKEFSSIRAKLFFANLRSRWIENERIAKGLNWSRFYSEIINLSIVSKKDVDAFVGEVTADEYDMFSENIIECTDISYINKSFSSPEDVAYYIFQQLKGPYDKKFYNLPVMGIIKQEPIAHWYSSQNFRSLNYDDLYVSGDAEFKIIRIGKDDFLFTSYMDPNTNKIF